MADPYDLQRFVTAQDEIDPLRGQPIYDVAVSELRTGRKASHWMWFIFPQLKGLGHTPRSTYYGIGSREEAVAYLAHSVLGPRLHRCAQLVAQTGTATARALLGPVDEMKLQSCMTLFAETDSDAADFIEVLRRFYDGRRDTSTVALLDRP